MNKDDQEKLLWWYELPMEDSNGKKGKISYCIKYLGLLTCESVSKEDIIVMWNLEHKPNKYSKYEVATLIWASASILVQEFLQGNISKTPEIVEKFCKEKLDV
jgi:hypothetical protein